MSSLKNPRRSLLAVAAIGTALLLSACANTATSSTADIEANPNAIADATAQLAEMQQPPVWGLSDVEPIDVSDAEGKKLWIIDINSAIELVQVSDAGTAEALGLAGAEVVTFDGQGSVTEYARGIQAAINDKADAIALYAIDPNVVAGPVAAAEAAGIPVIAVQYGDPGTEVPEGIAAHATYPYSLSGETMANVIAVDADGAEVGVQLIHSSDVNNSKDVVRGFEETLAANCPNCTLYKDDVQVADWQTKIPTQVNSTLNSHPDIQYVVPIYDGMATFAIPGIKTSGRTDVQVVTTDGSRSAMEFLGAGDTVLSDTAAPQAWVGWAIADQFLRLVTENEPLDDEQVGLRLFTADNVSEIDLTAPQEEWFGVDYETEYQKLWGLK